MGSTTLIRRSVLVFTLLFTCVAWAGDVIWIDVRTPEEFTQKHVPDAVNIPYDQIGSGIYALGLEKDQLIFLYCRSGRRAGIAKETLDELGFSQVVNAGGLTDALARAETGGRE